MNAFFRKAGIKEGLMFAVVAIAILGLAPTRATAMEKQERSNWCWAACIQEVLKFHHVAESQSNIVTKLRGWPANTPARIEEVAMELRNAYGLSAVPANYPPTPAQLQNCLMQGKTIIALINPARNPFEGHFVVLSGGNGNVVGVGDPAKGNVRPYPAQDIYNAAWLGSVVVNP